MLNVTVLIHRNVHCKSHYFTVYHFQREDGSQKKCLRANLSSSCNSICRLFTPFICLKLIIIFVREQTNKVHTAHRLKFTFSMDVSSLFLQCQIPFDPINRIEKCLANEKRSRKNRQRLESSRLFTALHSQFGLIRFNKFYSFEKFNAHRDHKG